MARNIWHPGDVIWSGENPFVKLRTDPSGDDLTRLSFFRVVWSPAGEGHALFMVSDLEGAGRKEIDTIFTDRPELGAWLQEEIMNSPFWAERRMPVVEAGFSFLGDSRQFRTEVVESADQKVELTWRDLDKPVAFCIEAEKDPDFHLLSLIIPAKGVDVVVNGRKAPGEPFPNNRAGRTVSSCCLSFSETWIRRARRNAEFRLPNVGAGRRSAANLCRQDCYEFDSPHRVDNDKWIRASVNPEPHRSAIRDSGLRTSGEVSERLKVPVSKTGVALLCHRGFESHPLRFFLRETPFLSGFLALSAFAGARSVDAVCVHQRPPKSLLGAADAPSRTPRQNHALRCPPFLLLLLTCRLGGKGRVGR